MKLTEFMDERYKNREDKDNIFGVGISDAEFRAFIIDYLLGEDWYVVDPLGQTQINEIALYEILKKYSKRYRKECKDRKRGKNMDIIEIMGIIHAEGVENEVLELLTKWMIEDRRKKMEKLSEDEAIIKAINKIATHNKNVSQVMDGIINLSENVE